jgi:hypothetical protein
MHSRIWWGDQVEIDHLRDIVVDVRRILKLIFKNLDVGHRLD